MIKGMTKSAILWATFSILAFFSFSILASAQARPKGNIIGFIYAKDGTTPLEGAIVKFKSLTAGTVHDSTRSDVHGIFKVQGVESGIYTYGVVTEGGDFNADNILGLKVDEKETAKLNITFLARRENEPTAEEFVCVLHVEPRPDKTGAVKH